MPKNIQYELRLRAWYSSSSVGELEEIEKNQMPYNSLFQIIQRDFWRSLVGSSYKQVIHQVERDIEKEIYE
jgi:hypothetical protein